MKAVLGMLLAAIPAGALAQENTKTVGSFTVDTQQDEISGKIGTVVYSKHLLGADDDTLGMLMVGCRDNTPAIRFYWGKFLMGNRIGRMAADDFVIDVQYRFPSEAQGIEQSWLGQPGRKAASPSKLPVLRDGRAASFAGFILHQKLLAAGVALRPAILEMQ